MRGLYLFSPFVLLMINAYSLYVLWLVRFVASSTTAVDTSRPTDTLGSTGTVGTGTPSTSGDVAATSESTIGGKQFVIYKYLLEFNNVIHV